MTAGMAVLRMCPYCKGKHRKYSMVKRCAKKYGPAGTWPRVGQAPKAG